MVRKVARYTRAIDMTEQKHNADQHPRVLGGAFEVVDHGDIRPLLKEVLQLILHDESPMAAMKIYNSHRMRQD